MCTFPGSALIYKDLTMTREDFVKLYEKNLSGRCSPEELRLLELYEDEFQLKDLAWDPVTMGDKVLTEAALYGAIKTGIEAPLQTARIRTLRRTWLAAAVMLPLIVAGIWWWSQSHKGGEELARQHSPANDIRPGGDKAILTLANGSTIVLDSAGNGVLTQQGELAIVKTAHGQLAYTKRTSDEITEDNGSAGTSGEVLSYNTVATPRGGQYSVILPDGSKAWLNAASSLRFPTAFRGKERRVELTGEAYFEITKSATMPFKVAVMSNAATDRADAAEIEVLGTSFNVMAYQDEPMINTTLIEGSVKVSKAGQSLLLKPGEQVIINPANALAKEAQVDVDATTAWKDGRFEFRGNIKSIMRQIARWYDVDVKYAGNVSDKSFAGAISRTADVAETLKILELTGSIHFTIEKRTITVTP